MPKINAEHDCGKLKCDGKKLNGMNVGCSRCDKVWYLECLIDENEIYELLKAIGLITLELDQNEASNKIKVKTNVTDENKDVFNAILGRDSPIEYVCLACKKKGKTKERIKSLENTIIKLDDKMKNEIDQKKKLEKQIDMQTTSVEENQKLINDLTMEIQQKNEIIEMQKQENARSECDNDDIDEDDDVAMKKTKQMIKITIAKEISYEFEKLRNMIDEKWPTSRCEEKCKQNKSNINENPFGGRRKVTFAGESSDGDGDEEENETNGNNNIQFDMNLIKAKTKPYKEKTIQNS